MSCVWTTGCIVFPSDHMVESQRSDYRRHRYNRVDGQVGRQTDRSTAGQRDRVRGTEVH